MQSFSTLRGKVRFTPKYIIVGGRNLFKVACNLILLVTEDPIQNFKIVAYLLLGYFGLVLCFVDKKSFLSHR